MKRKKNKSCTPYILINPVFSNTKTIAKSRVNILLSSTCQQKQKQAPQIPPKKPSISFTLLCRNLTFSEDKAFIMLA